MHGSLLDEASKRLLNMTLLKKKCTVCDRPLENIISQLKGVGPVCERHFPKCKCGPASEVDVGGHKSVNGWLAPYCVDCDGFLFPEGLGKRPDPDEDSLTESYRERMEAEMTIYRVNKD